VVKEYTFMLKSINEAFSFLLELAMLAAFAYAGFHFGKIPAMHYLCGIGLPVLVIIFWAKKMAPQARNQFPYPLLLITTFVLFEASAIALYFAGRILWAVVLAFAALINVGLRFIFKTSEQQKSNY
jgi:hypothetical protein